ncbi:MAG: homocysteine S-methyltransferase family protein [Ilumatobacteraceae bacterium]
MEFPDITLLDGGMGQELLRTADAEPTPLWSAQVMIDQPDLVRCLHRRFIDAGADMITVNAYSATRCRLGPAGRETDYERLQTLACELAVEARDDRDDLKIAGCLSPYGWSYRPDITLPLDELTARYAETAALQAPFVDVIICETMGSIHEATAALTGAATTDTPVWVSWSLLDDETGRLRSGETLADAIAAVADLPAAALLVNCSVPESFTAVMPTLARATVPFGAYANGFTHIAPEFEPGTTVTVLGRRHDLVPSAYADAAMGWVDQGATIVGGCCEIGPDHIAELAHRLGRAIDRVAPIR